MDTKCRTIDKNNITEFLESFDAVLCDCDGVIWNRSDPVENSVETLNRLQELGKKVLLVTNNSSKTRNLYEERCQAMKLNVKEEHIYCPPNVCATFLKQLGFKKNVYLVGNSFISKALSDAGINNFGVGPDPFKDWSTLRSDLESCVDDGVGAVVVGCDVDVSYSKFTKAARYLEDPECLFLATDAEDVFNITTTGQKAPAVGALAAVIETCSKRRPTVLGKPASSLFEVIQKDHGLQPERTLMIGDRGDTDMLFGKNSGLQTLLVLTGVAKMSDVSKWTLSTSPTDALMLPDYYLPKLGDLLPLIQ